MAEDALNLPNEHNIEYHLVTLFEKLENLKNDTVPCNNPKTSLQIEIRTLEFWRSVISECLASFIYVLVVCGAAAGAGAGSSVVLSNALAAGFAMTSLTQCFGHISGAHVNPAVSIAMGVTKKISVLRTIMFIVAQCGGAIAGAAFFFGVVYPGYQNTPIHDAPWERFGTELILTYMVVFSYFVAMDSFKKWLGTSSLTIGATYSACSFVSMPYLNPARSLGPCFVLNKWDSHWVYWLGALMGGTAAGLTYEYIFNTKRNKKIKEPTEGDSSSIHSDEDTYDNLDKPTVPKFHGSTYNTYRAAAPTVPSGYCPSLTSASLYSAPATKLERVESLYGGTKSLYCKSPPLTRANLNRSQSVYTKSNSGVNRDITPKPGPLVPAQSLYPMRLNQPTQVQVQNQNLQNQLQQRSENVYGIRGVTPGTSARSDTYSSTTERSGYNGRTNPSSNETKHTEDTTGKSRRPESMYGFLGRRAQSSGQSDDSSYGSYHGSSPRNNSSNSANTNANCTYQSQNSNCISKNGFSTRNGTESSSRPPLPPTSQLLSASTSSYHHAMPQHSPNPQY